jgi:hypothetical protein
MAGYTGFTSGLVNGRQTYIPFYVSFSLAYNRNVFLMVGSFLFV